jgi:GGDEF domain-containing protein
MHNSQSENVLCAFNLDNNSRELYHQIKELGTHISKGKARYFEKCTIIAVTGKVIFRIEGSEFYILAKPTHNIIAEVYYTDFKEALENERSKELLFEIKNRTLHLNQRKITCEVKEHNATNFNLEAGLGALNFSGIPDNDLHSQTEIHKLKSTGEEIHISVLKREADKAALLLKKFNVKSEDILKLILAGLRG